MIHKGKACGDGEENRCVEGERVIRPFSVGATGVTVCIRRPQVPSTTNLSHTLSDCCGSAGVGIWLLSRRCNITNIRDRFAMSGLNAAQMVGCAVNQGGFTDLLGSDFRICSGTALQLASLL